MRILVIANKKPQLNMLHVVEDLHILAIVTLGNLQLEDLIVLPHVGDIPKVGIYGPDDTQYMDQVGITNVAHSSADVYGEIISGKAAAKKHKPVSYYCPKSQRILKRSFASTTQRLSSIQHRPRTTIPRNIPSTRHRSHLYLAQ